MELTMEQCCERLENMDDIAVLCHRNPDGDTLGCAFALKYMLEQLGKRVQVKSHDGFLAGKHCIHKIRFWIFTFFSIVKHGMNIRITVIEGWE